MTDKEIIKAAGDSASLNIRRIDDLGRIAIPKVIRLALEIKEGDPFEIRVEGDEICIKQYRTEVGEWMQ